MKFRIENRAANHRRKIEGNWRRFGYGDEIELTKKQYESGAYDHLRLKAVVGTETKDEEPVVTKTDDQGNSTDNETTNEELQDLLARIKDSKVGDGSFEEVREELVELDLFDNLPESKQGVIQVLEDYLDEGK